jgi:cysteinyl-tRNA synthetase
MYVCGITVYDYCHLGHARMLLVFDLVQRWLRASGYRVTYVRNITDIEDKIIRRAQENGETIEALTSRFIRAMDEDAAALGVQKPDHEPRATQYVNEMLRIIGSLQEKELAYQAASGDVNYAVRRFPGYGRLSGKSLDELRAGERVEVDASKQDPLDFVLWKRSKPEEPKWPSPWGEGRPGWHIECSAMSSKLLGEHFDIHGGGEDLQFPHHENEIAQSEGAMGPDSGRKFVNYWMHNAFVRVDEEKMSKSLGNFFTVREILKKYDPEVVRFFILRAHYRSPISYSDTNLEDAKNALARLYTALRAEPKLVTTMAELGNEVDWNEVHAKRFREAMDDDFGTPEAVAVLFDIAHEIGRGRKELVPQLRALGAVLGLLQQNPEQYFKNVRIKRPEVHLSDERVNELVNERSAAKAAKDFKTADRIREELQLFGVLLEDRGGVTEWKRASAYRLLALDELEDFRFEAGRSGYKIENFRIREYPDPTPATDIYFIKGQIEITHLPTGRTLKLKAGHGSTWPAQFSEMAGRRYFD